MSTMDDILEDLDYGFLDRPTASEIAALCINEAVRALKRDDRFRRLKIIEIEDALYFAGREIEAGVNDMIDDWRWRIEGPTRKLARTATPPVDARSAPLEKVHR